jgi:hypothetical protein
MFPVRDGKRQNGMRYGGALCVNLKTGSVVLFFIKTGLFKGETLMTLLIR